MLEISCFFHSIASDYFDNFHPTKQTSYHSISLLYMGDFKSGMNPSMILLPGIQSAQVIGLDGYFNLIDFWFVHIQLLVSPLPPNFFYLKEL